MHILRLVTDWTVQNSPKPWGMYHLICWAITILVTVLLCVFVASKHDAKKDRLVTGIFGAALLLSEVYKQIFYYKMNGYYNVYDFPLQFCSVPMWVMFFIGVLPDGKYKDAMYKFLATAGLIAGISVMVFPSGVFATNLITILIHTMFWHGSMIIVGTYIIVSKNYAKSIKNCVHELVPGILFLYAVITVALLINIIWHYTAEEPLYNYLVSKGINSPNAAVNFFYISPFGDNTLVVLGWFRVNTPYPFFLFMYYLAFTLGCILVWFIAFGINWIIDEIHNINNTEKHHFCISG